MGNGGYIGNQDSFITKSFKRQSWLEKKSIQKKRECLNHPDAFWGKNDAGFWWEKCVQGFRSNEICKMKKNIQTKTVPHQDIQPVIDYSVKKRLAEMRSAVQKKAF